VTRFLATAARGLKEPVDATYRYFGPYNDYGQEVAPTTFSYVYAPGRHPAGANGPPFEYDTSAGGYQYRAVYTRAGFFECLRTRWSPGWSCQGPSLMGGNGGMTTELHYDVEVWAQMNLRPPSSPSKRSSIYSQRVDGRALSCLSWLLGDATVGNLSRTTYCLTSDGVIAYVAGGSFVRSFELVRLSRHVPAGVFSLPARPTRRLGFVYYRFPSLGPPGGGM
jgi:hypothetical protein